jgi:hypothetical protein
MKEAELRDALPRPWSGIWRRLLLQGELDTTDLRELARLTHLTPLICGTCTILRNSPSCPNTAENLSYSTGFMM